MPKSITFGPNGGYQHVAGLEVTVHQPGGVDGGQRGGHADREPLDAGRRQRPLRGDQAVQRRALDVLGDEPGQRGGRLGVQHPRGAGGGDAARGVDLRPEAGAEGRVPRQLRPDDLDRDPQPVRGAREIDRAHAAASQPGDHAVAAERFRVARLQR
jgi:hypothetical protein